MVEYRFALQNTNEAIRPLALNAARNIVLLGILIQRVRLTFPIMLVDVTMSSHANTIISHQTISKTIRCL